MNIIDQIVEQNIEESIQRGELDDLPGAGLPIDLDDDSMVPPELRATYRI